MFIAKCCDVMLVLSVVPIVKDSCGAESCYVFLLLNR